MKRFLFDTLCILLIVIIGKSLTSPVEKQSLEQRMDSFNQQIQNEEVIIAPEQHLPLNQVNENFAGRLGSTISEGVVNIIDGSVRFISTIFSENMK